MSKTQTSNINYKSLLFSTVKQKSYSFTIGLLILLFIASFSFAWTLPKVKPLMAKVFSNENGQTKGQSVTPTKKVRTYVVQPGDQLFMIAEKIYGSGLNMQDIMQTNKISNPDSIEVGQKLIIPDVKPRFPTNGDITDSAAKTEKVIEKSEKYTVKPGDDLAKIALENYGDSYAWVKIAEANNLLDPDDLRVGMILIIPR